MNKYEILERIGEGQYGVVLKGQNKQTGQLVAIKKFKEDDSDQQNKRVILRQVKILKTLNHQNIIQLKEAFRKKGKIYLVCQYVQKNLLEHLQQAPIYPTQVKHIAKEMLKAINYMHSINILHRDIKPENVLISKTNQVKLCDFGFARTIPSNRLMTDYVATRWYRPPELLLGKDDYDKSIDIWSVGCVLAEMIDGQPLFSGENDLDQLYLIQKCLGSLIPEHQETFYKNPKFSGMKFPQINNLQSIQRRYFGKIDKQGLDLLKKMLKMDPRQRITAQQALNHPFFSKNDSIFIIDNKKTKGIMIEQIKPQQINNVQSSNSNNQLVNQKSPISVNNFLQEKQFMRQQKIGTNKVTGLLKIKRAADNISVIRHNIIHKQEQSQFKGKSLGSKKVQVLKDKFNGPITDKKKRGLKQGVDKSKLKHAQADAQQYYEQKWQAQGNNQAYQPKKQNSPLLSKQKSIKECQSPTKRQQTRKSKILSKNYRKDNFNLAHNPNTYNLVDHIN